MPAPLAIHSYFYVLCKAKPVLLEQLRQAKYSQRASIKQHTGASAYKCLACKDASLTCQNVERAAIQKGKKEVFPPSIFRNIGQTTDACIKSQPKVEQEVT
eukprot:1149435-Pelagomonas_calceolata.AAC.3